MAISTTIGQLRHTATLQKNTPVANSSGGYTDNYTDVCTFRCRVREKSGSRQDAQGEIILQRQFELICRAQTAIVIDQDSRITYNGASFSITNFYEDNEIKHWLILTIVRNG